MGNKQGKKKSHASGSVEGEEREGRLHALSQGFYKRVRCTRRLLPSRTPSSTSHSHSNSLIAFRDPTGWTIAHHACKIGNVALCEIAKMGVSLSARDSELVTPAHVAAEYNRFDCLRTLFMFGINLEERDRFGQTPAHYAVWHGNIESVQMLHSLGVKLEIEDEDNRTCAHYAARNADMKMLQLLKELGVSMGRRDSRGLLPKHYAPKEFETMSRLTVCASDEVFHGKETADCTTSKSPRTTPISSAEANLHRRKTMMDTDNVLDAQYREKLRLPSERRCVVRHSPNVLDMSAQSLIIPLYGDDDVVLQALSEFETKERDAQKYEMKQDAQKVDIAPRLSCAPPTHVPCADEEEPVSSPHSSKEQHSIRTSNDGGTSSLNAPYRISNAPPASMTIYPSTGYHAGIPGPQNNAPRRDTTPLNWRSCTPAKPGPPSALNAKPGALLLDDNGEERNKKLEAGPPPSLMACGEHGGEKITSTYGHHEKARSPRRPQHQRSNNSNSIRPQEQPETITSTSNNENPGEEKKPNNQRTTVVDPPNNSLSLPLTVGTDHRNRYQLDTYLNGETPNWNKVSRDTTETMDPGEEEEEEEEIIADFCEHTTSTMPMCVSPESVSPSSTMTRRERGVFYEDSWVCFGVRKSTSISPTDRIRSLKEWKNGKENVDEDNILSPQQTTRTGVSSEDWCRPSTSISPRDRIRSLKESNKNNENEKSEQETHVEARNHAQPRTNTRSSTSTKGNSNNTLSNCRSSLGISSSMVERKGDTCIMSQGANIPRKGDDERKSGEKTEEEDGIGLVKARILKWQEEERRRFLPRAI